VHLWGIVSPERFQTITGGYKDLRIGIVGDFCLDRYLEIDPEKTEVSIETGLPVYNVVNVRSQPGGAGTILNNLVALGVGTLFPVGMAGNDGEGYELQKAMSANPAVRLDHFVQTSERHTFAYCKPLIVRPGTPPQELNRFDQKNWSTTPASISKRIGASILTLSREVDAIILLSQVDQPETGVVTSEVLGAIRQISQANPKLPILADSRAGFAGFPPVIFKMNEAELRAAKSIKQNAGINEIGAAAGSFAVENKRPVFVTMAARGMLGASVDGRCEHVDALPLRGPIDIVGAGDAVTANLAAALARGASILEALELANAAASAVIHQLGTTGVATVADLRGLIDKK
jgi:rfaE bifunctional protein kinase chain/domain